VERKTLVAVGVVWSLGERSIKMPRHRVEGESKDAAAKRDDELVSRAAKRTDWAGSALEGAADDLEDVGTDESGLTALAETVQDEAEHVSRLAKDIESQRTDMGVPSPRGRPAQPTLPDALHEPVVHAPSARSASSS
jgi:cell division protein FtsN